MIDRLQLAQRRGPANSPPDPVTGRTFVTRKITSPALVFDLEPRLVSRLRENASVTRWVVGPVAEDGTRAGVVRATSDFDFILLVELDLAVSDQYNPGRVVVDVRSRADGYVQFEIVNPLVNPQETVFGPAVH